MSVEFNNIAALRVLKNKKPLCFVNENLLISEYNKLTLVDLEKLLEKGSCVFPASLINKLLSKFKIVSRLLRLGIGCATYHSEFVYFSFEGSIYRLDPRKMKFEKEFDLDNGRGPLYLASLYDIPNFKDGLYFGEYFSNPKKNPVSIYFRDDHGVYSKVYTFEKGLVNHVHNIIPDKIRSCVWVLTGDFGQAACIWKTDDGFKNLIPVQSGSQQFRSCIAFPINNGLLYATDSQLEKNQLRLLREDNGTWVNESLMEINGSCIYGCRVGNDFIISTSSEPDIKNYPSFIHKWLDNKRGPGIIKNESHIICGNIIDGFKIIDVKKKDILPYRLFQFGSILFPSGENPTNNLFLYSIANKGYDLDTEVRTLDALI